MNSELQARIALALADGGVPSEQVPVRLAGLLAEIGELPAVQDGVKIRAALADFWQRNGDLYQAKSAKPAKPAEPLAPNPFERGTAWSMTQQMLMQRRDPALAARMKASARG